MEGLLIDCFIHSVLAGHNLAGNTWARCGEAAHVVFVD